MIYTLSQKREAYNKLTEETRKFIMDEETTNLIDRFLNEVGLNEEMSALANTEVINAAVGLISLEMAIVNIAKISEKNTNDLSVLRTNLENNIFNKLQPAQTGTKKTDPAFAKKKVSEIVGKYGLSSSQALVLENEVMSVIDGNPEEKITALDLVNLLNISNLLAEQIAFELESRVFERGVKLPEKPQPSQYVVAETKQTAPTPTVETKPETFGSTLNIPKEMMVPKMENEALDKQKPTDGTSIGVPRYATEDIYKSQTTSPVSNPINNKLGGVTTTIKPIETKYQKDPYREAIE